MRPSDLPTRFGQAKTLVREWPRVHHGGFAMMTRRRFLTGSAASIALGAHLIGARAFAQASNKVHRIVVGFPPGGPTDVVARVLADKMRGSLAPTLIVDNRPGAGGRIAIDHVRTGDPDGSTMLLTPNSMITIYPHVYKKLTYDPFRDLTPVARVCSFPLVLTIGPSVPNGVTSVPEFVEWLKANPQQARFGMVGLGATLHFVGFMFGRAIGVPLTYVPYKGSPAALQDLMGGQIPLSVNPLGDVLPLVQAGRVRALAITAAERSSLLPNAPTLKESGFADLVVSDWLGLFVSAQTPPETIERLNASVREALKSQEIAERLTKLAYTPAGESPTEFAKLIRAEHEWWAPVVKASGFSVDE
jgi:tripartite-type tricarboxylate transporter receptor subunit TctC